MRRYSTPKRSKLRKRFRIVDGLEILDARPHAPGTAQPSGRRQLRPHLAIRCGDGRAALRLRGRRTSLLNRPGFFSARTASSPTSKGSISCTSCRCCRGRDRCGRSSAPPAREAEPLLRSACNAAALGVEVEHRIHVEIAEDLVERFLIQPQDLGLVPGVKVETLVPEPTGKSLARGVDVLTDPAIQLRPQGPENRLV